MNQEQIDRALLRRLYVQRYISAQQRRYTQGAAVIDRALLRALSAFTDQASAADIAQLARRNPNNVAVRELLAAVNAHVRALNEQATRVVVDEARPFAESELRATAPLVGLGVGAAVALTARVLQEAVAGSTAARLLSEAHAKYKARLLSEIALAAAERPDQLRRSIQGRRDQSYRDGLAFWRNQRLVLPVIDQSTASLAANAQREAYTEAAITQVAFVATLDFRTCPQCLAAEAGGPYPLAQHPRPSLHPRCRCVIIPYIDRELSALTRKHFNIWSISQAHLPTG